MSSISEKPGLTDQGKTKAQLLTELNELRQRVAQLEAAAAEPLNQSAEHYRSVVRAMAEGVVMQQRSGEIVACNPAAEQILGLSREQMMGRTSVDPRWRAIHPDGTPFPGESHPAMITLQTGQPQRNVVMGVHKPDGGLTWISINSEPLFESDVSQPHAVVTTFSDVTEHWQAAEQLRQSEEKYRVIFNNEIYAIVIFDLTTLQLLEVNEAYTRLYGYSRDELLSGMTIHDITTEHQACDESTQQAIREGTIFIPLRYHRKKDGTVFPVEIVGGPYQWQGRQVMFALTHDITKRQQTEQTLRWNESLLQMMAGSSPLAFLVVDNRTDAILYFNRHFCEIWGITHLEEQMRRGELKNNDIIPACLPVLKDVPAFAESCKPLQDELNRIVVEDEIPFIDGRIIRRFSTQIRGEHDEYYGRFYIFEDITQRKQIDQGLRESEARFRKMFTNHAAVMLLVEPTTGQIIDANLAAAEFYGYPASQLCAMNIADLNILSPDQIELERQKALTEKYNVFVFPHRLASGEIRTVEVHSSPIALANQPILFSIIHDITARKQAEKALLESQERLALTIKGADLGIWDWHGPSGSVVFNERWAEMLGYTLAEIEPHMHSWEKLLHPDDAPAVLAAVNAHLEGRTSLYQTEHRLRSKSGEWKWVLATGQVLERDEQGQPVRVVGIHQDITERKRMEQALQASEARLKAVFELAGVGIRLSDAKGRWIQGNPALEQMLGYSLEELSHLSNLDLTHPDDRAVTQMWMAALAAGQADSARLEKRHLHKDGRTVWVDLSVTPVRDEQGQVVSFIGIAVDITGRKQAEAALRRSDMVQRAVLEAIPDFMFWTDPQGHYIPFHEFNLVSSAASHGMPVKKLNEALPQNVAEGILSRIPLAYETGEVQTFEYSLVLQDEIRYYEAHLVNTLLDEILCTLRDITTRKQAEEALRESEQKLRQIIEHSGDGIMLTNETGQIVEWNPALEQIAGLHRVQVIGQPSWEVLFGLLPNERQTPSIYEHIKTTSQAYFQTGQDPWMNQVAEFELQRLDGSYRDIQTIDYSIKTGRGFGRGSVIRDVTERKQVERIEAAQLAVSRVLAESPEVATGLSQVLEAIAARLGWQSANLWQLDSSGSRMVWQDGWFTPDLPELAAFKQVSQGYTFEPGEGLTGAVWQAGRAIWDQDLHLVKGAPAALTGGFHSTASIPIIRDEVTVGVMVFFSRSVRPLEERLLATLTDLGQQIGQFLARKEAEEALRRYKQMVSTSPDWLSLVDHNYVYRIVNQTYLTLNNKPYDQIVGHSVIELMGEVVFIEVVKPRLDQALAGETIQYQEWFDFPNAGRRFNDVTYAPYRERDGTISGALVSGRDVTEAKLLEEHLQQVQKMGAIGQLAAGMAHHYNSMLTTIIGYTSLSLHTLPPGDPLARDLNQVLQTAERMAVLVRQLLAFAGKQLLQLKTAPLNDLVIQLQGELKQVAPAPIEFILDLAAGVGEVKIDLRQFEYLLRALVSNARDAMPQGGRLTLTTTPVSLGPVEAGWYDLTPGDYILLTVKDSGIGLTDEVKAHLFEPFFTTKEVGQGTGLGLAMSLGIAKQHGGHLLAESQPGQGATFMLYLPCLTPPPPSLSPARSIPAQTILLVEAEPMVREFVAEILSDQGYVVLKATSDEVALQLIAGWPEVSLQLLLTPIHSNSQALIEQLKTNSPGLKVIFLIDELEELPQVRVDFLLKPFTPSGLIQKVRAVLEAIAE